MISPLGCLCRNAVLCLALCVLTISAGCDKKGVQVSGDNATPIGLGGNDIKADGTLAQSALDQLGQKSAEPRLSVNIVRSRISDAGLKQLAQFKNIKRINAVGSALSDKAIAAFKAEVPDSEVVK